MGGHAAPHRATQGQARIGMGRPDGRGPLRWFPAAGSGAAGCGRLTWTISAGSRQPLAVGSLPRADGGCSTRSGAAGGGARRRTLGRRGPCHRVCSRQRAGPVPWGRAPRWWGQGAGTPESARPRDVSTSEYEDESSGRCRPARAGGRAGGPRQAAVRPTPSEALAPCLFPRRRRRRLPAGLGPDSRPTVHPRRPRLPGPRSQNLKRG